MGYISEKTKQKIYELVTAQFQLNRYFDSAMSVNGNWAMFDGFAEKYVNLVFEPRKQ